MSCIPSRVFVCTVWIPPTPVNTQAALLQMLDTVFQMFYEPDFTDFENESEE